MTIDFNLCEYTFRSCPDEVKDFVNIVNENNTCNHMSSDSLHDVNVSLIDTNKPDLGLRLLYEGNTCNATHKYSLLL